MRKQSLATVALLVSLAGAASAATWTVGNQTAFGEGAYAAAFYNTTGFVQLALPNTSGNYTSRIFDAGSVVQWARITDALRDNSSAILQKYALGNLTINTSARSCNDSLCSFSPWTPVGIALSQPLSLPDSRFFQFRLALETDSASESPEIANVTVDYGPRPPPAKRRRGSDPMNISASGGCVGEPVKISAFDRSGDPISGVSITVRGSNPYGPKAAELKTDRGGKASFAPAKADTYSISADKDGYYDAEASIAIGECGCVSDSECAPDEACKGGSCDEVSCVCGVARNHACDAYGCCLDSDCAAGYSCIANLCIANSPPQPAVPTAPFLAVQITAPPETGAPEPSGAAVAGQPAMMPILPAIEPVSQGIPRWLPFLLFFLIAAAIIFALYDATRFKTQRHPSRKRPEMPEWKKKDLEAARKAAITAAAVAAEKTPRKVHKKRPPVPKRPLKTVKRRKRRP